MDKNHDCITKVREQLKNDAPEINWIRFDLSTIQNASIKNPINKTGQRIEYGYTHKKKDGSTVEKVGKSFVSHKYCPFCGEEYP